MGTRTAGRTVTDSPVPVDVFSQDELESVGASADLTDVISKLVPSFNVGREPISDGATFVRPPNLRGLDSDKTLVLINGKRRHRAALVRLGGFGSHGPDLAAIPVIALRSVEVLRDGAGAQYGSDAIAGVMNFNLKQSYEGSGPEAPRGGVPGRRRRPSGSRPHRIQDRRRGIHQLQRRVRQRQRHQPWRAIRSCPAGRFRTDAPGGFAGGSRYGRGRGLADRFGPDVFTEVTGRRRPFAQSCVWRRRHSRRRLAAIS